MIWIGMVDLHALDDEVLDGDAGVFTWVAVPTDSEEGFRAAILADLAVDGMALAIAGVDDLRAVTERDAQSVTPTLRKLWREVNRGGEIAYGTWHRYPTHDED